VVTVDRWERAYRRALRYRPCGSCTYNVATGEGTRDCQYGDCPALPFDLDPHCPTCRHNFYTGEGGYGCGDRPTCDFARDEAPHHVALLRRWLDAQTPAGA
jgi:hypothetical protein